MRETDQLLKQKILTPALWEHRIKVRKQIAQEVTHIIIKYQPKPEQSLDSEKENVNLDQQNKWQEMLKKMELNINGINLSFK